LSYIYCEMETVGELKINQLIIPKGKIISVSLKLGLQTYFIIYK